MEVKTKPKYDSHNIKIIRVKELCSLLEISIATLYRWHANGDIPIKKLKFGKGTVGYRQSDVEEWLNNSQQEVDA